MKVIGSYRLTLIVAHLDTKKGLPGVHKFKINVLLGFVSLHIHTSTLA